jgi:SAM-dependent methyltransferase
VLDLGCGSGRPIAEHLDARGCRITGVDGAAALVDLARERLPGHRWITADMRKLPALGPFHGVLAWHSFFHLRPEAQRPMFGTFARLCRPGGGLLFTTGTEHGEAIGTFAGRPLYQGSLDAAEYRGLLRSNGFEILRHVEEDPSCGGATVWMARRRADNGSTA